MIVLILAAFMGAGSAPPVPARSRQADLDEFMAEVVARRDENWRKLQQYLLDERERIDVRGPSGAALWAADRTYLWYIRDGFFVRSPVSANGVSIGEPDRRAYENRYLERARRRDAGGRAAGPDDPVPNDVGGLLAQSRQPQFIDSAYFLRFRFESGRYALVGRERFEGTDVLRVEYYPNRLFVHEQEAQEKREAEGRIDRGEDAEAAMERLMNKASLVTLWIAPASRQIVKYTFDNVSLDFLPASWLVRVHEITASMTMSQPFAGVWLPQSVDMRFSAMLAIGPLDLRYRLDYDNYREAATSGRLVPAVQP